MFGLGYRSSDEMNYSTWFERSLDELKFCLWPRRCYATNRLMWLEFAYRSRRHFRAGDIDMITEDRWFDQNEFVIIMLKLAPNV